MLLSIIIPAYNAEKYIAECLDSCYRWTSELAGEEMEVIVVDDGSTDSTPTLLKQQVEQHANLRILHQVNQGQSVARNLAIESAQGDYIYMVDADDAMMGPLPWPTMREGRHDIIAVQVMYQREDGTRQPWSHQMERWPFDQEYATGADFVKSHNIEGLVYGYLFRRQLFVEHPTLRFTPGIYHQDEELIFKIFTLAGPVVYKRGYAYLYFEHSGSSLNTHTAERKQKLLQDDIIILQNLIAWRDQRQLRQVMNYKLAYLAMDVLRYLVRKQYDEQSCKKTIEQLKSMGLYPLPWILEAKYLAMKLLTQQPQLVIWWARQRNLSQKIGF